DAPEGLERNTIVGISLAIPLPLWDRNEEAIDDALIEREKVRRTLQAAVFQLESDLRAALDARKAAYTLARAANGEVPRLAQATFEDFQTAQQSGQATLLQVQQAQEQLVELENSALELMEDYLL